MPLGTRRQDFDDQKWVLDRLAPGLYRGAGCGDIGDEVGVRPVWTDHSGFDLCVTGSPGGQSGIDPAHQAHREDAVSLRRRCHCHRKAADQLVMRLGAVVPPEKLVQGHRLYCKLGHGPYYTIAWVTAITGHELRREKKFTLSRAGGTG